MTIILMGLIFKTKVPKKVTIKRNTLIQNCQAFSEGEEKFSLVQRSSVAAANRPTTAGRNPMKTDWTVLVRMYLRNILLMRIIRMSDGRTRAKVAVNEPKTAIA